MTTEQGCGHSSREAGRLWCSKQIPRRATLGLDARAVGDSEARRTVRSLEAYLQGGLRMSAGAVKSWEGFQNLSSGVFVVYAWHGMARSLLFQSVFVCLPFRLRYL